MSSTANENIFTLTENGASRFKLRSVCDDSTSTQSSSRVNHSTSYTQLIKAVTEGNLGLVKQMLDIGLDVNYIYDTENNYSFLHLACLMGHSKIVKFLLDQGASPYCVTNDGHQPIDFIESDDLTTISYMLVRMNTK